MCFVVLLRTRHSEYRNVIKSGNQILRTQWLVLLLVEGCSCPFVRWLLQSQKYSLCVWSLKLQLCCLFSQPMTWQRFCLNVMSFFVFLSVHVSLYLLVDAGREVAEAWGSQSRATSRQASVLVLGNHQTTRYVAPKIWALQEHWLHRWHDRKKQGGHVWIPSLCQTAASFPSSGTCLIAVKYLNSFQSSKVVGSDSVFILMVVLVEGQLLKLHRLPFSVTSLLS